MATSNSGGLSASDLARLVNATNQQTTAYKNMTAACNAYSKSVAQSTSTAKADTSVQQRSLAERDKVSKGLNEEARAQTRRSAAVEQTLADLDRTWQLFGIKTEEGKMRYETRFGKFAGEDDKTREELLWRARELDQQQQGKDRQAYINGITGKDPEKDAQIMRKRDWLEEARNTGEITEGQYAQSMKGLEEKKPDEDFMSKLNGKLVESARDGAGKIQDVLGTKMYDFVADKFDKMGLSFLNNVAKMATSAASAKLMETLLGGDFMSGKNGGGLGGWIGAAGSWISGLFGGGASAGAAAASGVAQAFPISMNAKGNAFTNGMVSSPVAFPMGVMGEAGPEAIMPLHRGSDGSLGIRAAFPNVAGDTGQVGGGVSVNVYVQDGNVNTETESGEGGWKQFGQQIGEYVNQLVDRRMTQSYRQGGLAWQASNNRLAGA
ncbi:phage tail tape measure protein [Achromobacter sp. UMC71]|uniref:phage tail tape measure protein n=1 Tax=Achromobacter sp. UMC71 TaxID=1862320 RepID=UPI0016002F0A|nr:phage tail tape measure protein [Achromobacter sp. UMC71]MBB1624262.1 phage tail tape measure protein [Achromobacter sp. UMC71]